MLRWEEQLKYSEYSDLGDFDEENDVLGFSYFYGGGRCFDDDGLVIGLLILRNWGIDFFSSSKVKIEDEVKENKFVSFFVNGGIEERGGKYF